MVVAAKSTISLAEFLQLPETKPASEYTDGQIYQKPMPQGKHSRLPKQLLDAISEVGEPQKLACAFPELRCTFGGDRSFPISLFLNGLAFPLMKMEKLPTALKFHRIG